jgi:hypothetical protein
MPDSAILLHVVVRGGRAPDFTYYSPFLPPKGHVLTRGSIAYRVECTSSEVEDSGRRGGPSVAGKHTVDATRL